MVRQLSCRIPVFSGTAVQLPCQPPMMDEFRLAALVVHPYYWNFGVPKSTPSRRDRWKADSDDDHELTAAFPLPSSDWPTMSSYSGWLYTLRSWRDPTAWWTPALRPSLTRPAALSAKRSAAHVQHSGCETMRLRATWCDPVRKRENQPPGKTK